jgi:hypothetical protein
MRHVVRPASLTVAGKPVATAAKPARVPEMTAPFTDY